MGVPTLTRRLLPRTGYHSTNSDSVCLPADPDLSSLLRMLSESDSGRRSLALTLLSSEARGRELDGGDFQDLSSLPDVPRPVLKRPLLSEGPGEEGDMCPVCHDAQGG